MKKLLGIFLAAFSMVSVANAELSYSMPAIEAGFKLNTMDYQGATSNKQTQAFQAGGSIVINFGSGSESDFGLRTGLFYSERPFKSETTLGDIKGKVTYAEVPLHFMFKLEDYAGIYLGPSFATKLGDECSTDTVGGCSLTDVESMVIPLTFGAQFKFAPNFGLNLFFETVSGDIAKGIKSSRGIGMNLLFAFN